MATSSDFKHERRRQWRRRGHDIIMVWICFPRCSEKWSCSDVSDRGSDCRWSPMMVGWRKSSDVSATDCRQPRAKCCMWAVGWLIRGNWWMRCDTISPSRESLTHLAAPAPCREVIALFSHKKIWCLRNKLMTSRSSDVHPINNTHTCSRMRCLISLSSTSTHTYIIIYNVTC